MSYKTFNDVFLSEMPQRFNGGNDFLAQLEMIRENLQDNDEITKLAPSVYKTQNGDQTTYWVGDASADTVNLIVDTEQHGSFRKVVLTSKNPEISKGSPPFASDLYVIIKNDSATDSLVFASDEFLSDDGIRLWKTIVEQGYKLAVYDTQARQIVLSPITDTNSMLTFLGDSDKRKYIFVMTETANKLRGAIHSFGILELKRLAGYPLFEGYSKISKQQYRKNNE